MLGVMTAQSFYSMQTVCSFRKLSQVYDSSCKQKSNTFPDTVKWEELLEKNGIISAHIQNVSSTKHPHSKRLHTRRILNKTSP
jgi:hypothetical protein